jgi:RHS repeat-associated protein
VNGSGTQEKHHFTSYESDTESGNDYAVNRGYSPSVGRFNQADPMEASGDGGAPQSWNRYSYTQNDPVNFIDPNGLFRRAPNDPDPCGWGEEYFPPPEPEELCQIMIGFKLLVDALGIQAYQV